MVFAPRSRVRSTLEPLRLRQFELETRLDAARSGLALGRLFVGRSREWRRRVFDDGFLPVMKAAGQDHATDSGGNNGDNDTHVLVPHQEKRPGGA
jgi:hypothetical protein